MKKFLLPVAFFLAFSAKAQTSFNPRTGDAEMDNSLKNINVKASADLPLFKKEISANFPLVKPKIEILLETMTPGDVYIAAEISDIIHKPIETVADSYKKNKDKGWGATAKELGIKPGSKEFHDMKACFKNKENKGKKADHGNSGAKGEGKENGKGKGKK